MYIQVESTKLHGVYKIKPKVHEDFRGEYVPLYEKQAYSMLLPDGMEFMEDDISVSYKDTLRGIHGDNRTWKLISCLYGRFYLVVVNNDKDSHEYRKWTSFTLSDKNREQILIPANYGNAHLVLSEMAIFHYKQSHTYRGAEHQFTIPYNDPDLNIFWPFEPQRVSRRDQGVLEE